jgi:RNase P/RNase MRP subunit p29
VQESTLVVTSDPSGAVVRVDGRLVGETPRQVRVTPGVHEIEVAKAGYRTEVRRADVRATSLTVPVELVALQRIGTVTVLAPGWDGADLSVDGRVVGKIPSELQLAEGLHVFGLRRGGEAVEERHDVRLSERGVARVVLQVP